MIDAVWQVTALASITAFSALGLYLRRLVNRLDRRRDARGSR